MTRARSDASRDLECAKQRLKSFLLRLGFHYEGKANWSEAHQRYLRELTLPLPALKSVLEEHLLAITAATARLTRHEELIAAQVPQWALYPAVQALMCVRGFDVVAASMPGELSVEASGGVSPDQPRACHLSHADLMSSSPD